MTEESLVKILIVDDEFVSRKLLHVILRPYGVCDIAVDGGEAIEAFKSALEEGNPYQLICMDIMMPGVDGQQALKEIRRIEKAKGISGPDEVKVLMITALGDPKNVMEAFYRGGATAYIVKPINHKKLIEEIRRLGLPI